MRRYLLDTGPLAAYLLGRQRAIQTIDPWLDRHEAATSILVYNVVYIGTFVQADPIDEERRSSIRLNHIQYVGVTDLNWLQFAEGGQNPIRYLP